jgi:hypothetical protein
MMAAFEELQFGHDIKVVEMPLAIQGIRIRRAQASVRE